MQINNIKVDIPATMGNELTLVGIDELVDYKTKEPNGTTFEVILNEMKFRKEYIKVKNRKPEEFEKLQKLLMKGNYVRIALVNTKIKCWQLQNGKAGVTIFADDVLPIDEGN